MGKNNNQEKELPVRFGLESFYVFLIQAGVCFILFTPFIFLRDYFFPFVVPKTIYFRIIVDIILVPYILLAVANPRYRPKFSWLTLAITIFLGTLVLTSFTGVNFARSFWSTFERMTGLLTLFHLFAFYIILTSVFNKRKYWERFFAVSIIVGIIICLYNWASGGTASRGGGTIGNTSFMAAYLLFDIFFSIILLLTKKDWRWQVFSLLSLAVLLAGLFVSIEPSRGAAGAFFIGLLIFGFFYLFFYLFLSGEKRLKKLALLLIPLVFLAVLIFTQLNFVQQAVKGQWGSTSIQSRVVIWKMGFEGWKERFWLGWGPENFNIVFAKYFDPQLPLSGDVWYDRVHNIVFDTAVTSGLAGLAAYLLIFIVAFFELLRIAFKVAEKRNLAFPLGAAALLAAYFIQDFFVFDMISSYMIFFFSLAFVNFLTQKAKPDAEPARSNLTEFNPFLGAALATAIFVVIYFGSILPARASTYTVYGLSSPLENAVPFFQKALSVSPISQFETPEQFSMQMINLAQKPTNNAELLQSGLKSAEEAMKKNIEENPSDFRSRLFLGRFYSNLYQLTKKSEYIDLSEQTLMEAVKYSPKNQQTYWTIAQNFLFQGRRQEAIEYLKKAMELEPRYGISHWYLAMAYRINKQYDLAIAELNEAYKFGYKWKESASDVKNVIELYRGIGDYNMLPSLFELAVSLDPKDVNSWAELADSYSKVGKKEQAKEAALKVLELDPSQADKINRFLRNLGY